MNEVVVNPPADGGPLNDYVPVEHSHDEMFSAPHVVRPAWRRFYESLAGIGRSELTRRWQRAQEEVRENGVAFNAYESVVRERPWQLDALPLLIDPEEWKTLVAGLVQRAALLNRIIADLHGPQELLRSGLLPAEWLYSHPAFRRRFHGRTTDGRPWLYVYAADLARGADGRWLVVGDRTDAPVGLGYALENRIAASRMLPNLIREVHVERLANFFLTLQQTLRGLAPRHRTNPRIVLLSQGPSGPNYFEDAYLARYLGYTLVEGGDLAVRDDFVYLKTLSGLLPVDVILRHLSDDSCDPLEGRHGTNLGVPGLVQSSRLGHVAIANALGTSIVESPSLMPFLPGIARRWSGQELLLPSVATWWCGQEAARAEAGAGRDRLKLRSAYRLAGKPSPPEDFSTLAPERYARMIESRPAELVAQEPIHRSTAPVWSRDGAEPCHVAMRVFLVERRGSYEVMPGGLVRLAPESRSLDLSVLAGEISKDAWVLSTGPVRPVSLLATTREPVILRRSGADVPSRVADNLFWFGRRIERAQGACRLLRQVVARLTGEEEADVDSPELATLIRCLAAHGQVEPGFVLAEMKDVLPPIVQALPNFVLDDQQSGSLRATFEQACVNASLVRDRLSLDSWRIVRRIQRELERAAELQPFELVELDELLDELVVLLAALDGLIGESMTRAPAWRFLELGRRLERGLYDISLVQSLLASPTRAEPRTLEAILEVADSMMTYRSRYLAQVRLDTALDLLLTDESNPRSLAFQLTAIAGHVANLPRGEADPLGTPEDRITLSLVHGVRMLEVEDLGVQDGGSERSKLERLLIRIAGQLPKLSDLISHRYLIHAGRPRQMTDIRPLSGDDRMEDAAENDAADDDVTPRDALPTEGREAPG